MSATRDMAGTKAYFAQTMDFHEVGDVLRGRTYMAELVSLADRQERFLNGVEELEDLFQSA